MKIKSFLVAGLMSAIVLASCSKEKDTIDPNIAIEGVWIGKYSILSEPYSNFYSFRFKAGGVLELIDITQTKKGEGTWAFTNDNEVISGTYTLIPPDSGTFSFVANFDKNTLEIDGTWGVGSQEYGGGYWYMNKL
ncbi:MAG: hypothetical protein H7X99_07875 [Saprospiraceae bacterium]|nr:hypothetical protein [Saprospiraceae bacterium]